MEEVRPQLSQDELLCIFEELGAPELQACSQVCSDWRRLARNKRLWQKILEQEPLVVPPNCRPAPWDVYSLHSRWSSGLSTDYRIGIQGLAPASLALSGSFIMGIQKASPRTFSVGTGGSYGMNIVDLGEMETNHCSLSDDGFSVFHWQYPRRESGTLDESIVSFSSCGEVSDIYVDQALRNGNTQALSMGNDGRIAFGLKEGSVCIVPRRWSNPTKVDYGRYGEPPICCIDARDDSMCAAGSELGDVTTVAWSTLSVSRRLIGPCDCRVSAVSTVNDKIVVGGYDHTQVGNGHRNTVIAWDVRASSRIGSFGRDVRGSGHSLLPVKSICGDRSEGRRIAVSYEDRIAIFDTRTWSCLREHHVADSEQVSAIAMNDERAVVGVTVSREEHLPQTGHLISLSFVG
mmetsp:Transcript_5149/g.22195  ORF Transcript_5149/g.22195 Transcript_5149/m.22195 type:complete len:404 (-) Transcript_5149:1146-2357(-)